MKKKKKKLESRPTDVLKSNKCWPTPLLTKVKPRELIIRNDLEKKFAHIFTILNSFKAKESDLDHILSDLLGTINIIIPLRTLDSKNKGFVFSQLAWSIFTNSITWLFQITNSITEKKAENYKLIEVLRKGFQASIREIFESKLPPALHSKSIMTVIELFEETLIRINEENYIIEKIVLDFHIKSSFVIGALVNIAKINAWDMSPSLKIRSIINSLRSLNTVMNKVDDRLDFATSNNAYSKK